jgi:hypothetical protein
VFFSVRGLAQLLAETTTELDLKNALVSLSALEALPSHGSTARRRDKHAGRRTASRGSWRRK